jgi:hypothetical protein
VVREGVGAGGRNEPSLVCTYEFKKKIHLMKLMLLYVDPWLALWHSEEMEYMRNCIKG